MHPILQLIVDLIYSSFTMYFLMILLTFWEAWLCTKIPNFLKNSDIPFFRNIYVLFCNFFSYLLFVSMSLQRSSEDFIYGMLVLFIFGYVVAEININVILYTLLLNQEIVIMFLNILSFLIQTFFL